MCSLGHYCTAGTAAGLDKPCPAGTFSDSSLLKAATECSNCLPGFYCSGGNITVSGDCARGYYCPSKTKYPTQYSCPAGTYSNLTNLYSISQCTPCEPGYFCSEASTEMTACPNGTFSSKYSSSSIGNCSICPAGYFCGEKCSEPKSCGVGYYSDFRSSTCEICPRGKYCGSNTTTLLSLNTGGGSWENIANASGTCFNGSICSLGMKNAPIRKWNSCPAGYYCPSGVEYPIACPAGRYNEEIAKYDISGCKLTPSGYYSLNATSVLTGLCDPGYYCPSGSSSPKQVPCPSRTYLPEYGVLFFFFL
jgi:hypothetical protein